MSLRKALFLFAISFLAFQTLASSTCETAVEAVEGVNHLPATDADYYWYSFTMPREGKVVIDPDKSVYFSLYSNSCSSLSYKAGGSQAVGYAGFSAGEQVLIQWQLGIEGSDFDWSLSVDDLLPGESCDFPQQAISGENMVPSTPVTEFWFTYSVPDNGLLVLSTEASVSFEVYTGDCDQLWFRGSGYQKLGFPGLSAGEDILIKIAQNVGGNFSLSIALEEVKEGENCSLAKPAISGENALPATNAQYFWYSYVMPQDGNLIIESNQFLQLAVLKGTCANYDFAADVWGNAGVGLNQGDELLIRWYIGNSDGNFNWNLSVEDTQPGETCATAETPVEGDNLIPPTNSSYFWYSVVMPENSTLSVDAENNSEFYVYKGSCESLQFKRSYFGQGTFGEVETGEEIFLRFNTASGGEYSWTLTFNPVVEGEICGDPMQAVEGLNSIPQSSVDQYWFTFTMPRAGKLVIDSEGNEWVELLNADCSDAYQRSWGNGKLTTSIIEAGEEVFIRWNTYGSEFDWELAVEDFGEGELCSLASPAVEGTNHLPQLSGETYWYSFEVPEDGIISVSSESSMSLVLYSNSCGSLSYLGGGSGFASVVGVGQGETILISWYSYQSGGDFDWTLSVDDYQEGQTCAMAVEVTEGEIQVPETNSSDFWYRFTMPTTGKLKITSVLENRIEILSTACPSPSYRASNFGTLAASHFQAGEELLVKIATSYQGGYGNFPLKFEVLDVAEGDVCNLAFSAIFGPNTAPETNHYEYWYKVKAPEAGKLVFDLPSNTYITVYTGTCGAMQWHASGQGKFGTPPVNADTEVLIRLENAYAWEFDWALALESPVQGEACQDPFLAADGVNNVPATNSQFLWYTFTMPKAGKLVVSSDTSHPVSILAEGCNYPAGLGYGNGAAGAVDLEAGQVVSVRWQFYQLLGTGFDWTLSVEDPVAGDNCELAVEATEGSNYIPVTASSYYWVHFTMPDAEKVKITTPHSWNNVLLYRGSCENLTQVQYGRSVYTNLIEPGEEVYARFSTNNGNQSGDFSWELSFTDDEVGDYCALPATAEMGMNHLPLTYNSSYWYSFTMPESGKLVINSSAGASVSVYSGECDNLLQLGSASGNLGVAGMEAGETVYISWFTIYTSDFDWEISVEEPSEGDSCELAIAAVEGENQVPVTNSQYHWYSFTMPAEKKLLITSEAFRNVYVFTSCDNAYYSYYGHKNLGITDLAAGQEIFIRWESGSSGFTWNLAVVDLQAGESCELAADAIRGTNSIPQLFTRTHWYTHTVEEEGKLIITIPESYYQIVAFVNGCDNLNAVGNSNGKLELTGLSVGQELTIQINNQGSYFDWTLAYEEYSAGDCILADSAIEGENTLPMTEKQYYWYNFTVPRKGKLVISSEATGQVAIVKNTCETPYIFKTGDGSLSYSDIEEGEEIFIRWFTQYSGGNFAWNLYIEDFASGESCATALDASIGINNVPVTTSDYYWYKFIVPEEGLLKIRSQANANVYVYSQSCESQWYKGNGGSNVTISDLEVGEELFIKWQLNQWTGSFDWTLAIEQPAPGEICDMAFEAQLGTNTAPGEGIHVSWFSFRMPEDGKLVVSSQSNSYVTIYKGNCDYKQQVGSGYQNFEAHGILQYEWVLLKWQNHTPENSFEWQMSIESYETGESCETAIEVQEGVHSISGEWYKSYWYSFTMPRAGKLAVKSETDNSAYLYDGCDGGYYGGNGSAAALNVEEGQTVLLEWFLWDNISFDWEIVVEEFEPGDMCSLPAEAVVGTNHVPATPVDQYWYSFTMPEDAVIAISSSQAPLVQAFVGSCDSNTFVGSANSGNGSLGYVAQGSDVLIQWFSHGASFDWDLALVEPVAGDGCELSVEAVVGENTVPATDGSQFWQSFVMPDNSKLTYSSTSNEYVSIYKGTCSGLEWVNSGREQVEATTLHAGDNVYLRISTEDSGGNFAWTLSLSDLQVGDNCLLAYESVLGENMMPATQSLETWSSFEMPIDGKFLVDAGSRAVTIYLNGCSWRERSYSVIGGISIPGLKVGDKVFMQWDTEEQPGGFSYTISADPHQIGDLCLDPKLAQVGENFASQRVQWFKFQVPVDGQLKISSLGESTSSSSLQLYSDCDAEAFAGSSGYPGTRLKLEDAMKGQEILIKWEDFNGDQGYIWRIDFEPTNPKQPQQITFTPPTTTTYGQTVALNATASSQLPVSYEVVSGPATIEGNTLKPTGAGTVTVKATQAGDTYYFYAADPVATEIVVEKAVLTVTAADKSITYGDQLPEFTYTISGFVNDETASVIAGNITAGLAEGVAATAGEHEIVVSGGSADNYTLSYVKGKLTVGKASQTITFAELSGVNLSTGTVQLSASASSSLAVSFTAEGPATVAGNVLTLTGAGQVKVIASQAGDNNYLAAESITRTFTVIDDSHKQPQTITFSLPEPLYENDGPITLNGTSTSELPVSYVVVEGPATVEGNVLTITGTGTVKVTANQAGDDTFRAAESVTASATVKPLLSISGSVAGKDGEIPEGTVVAAFTGGLAAGSSQLIGGQFTIGGLKDASYYLKYVPSETFQEKYRTTYYEGTEFGSSATKVEIAGQDIAGVTWSAIAKVTKTETPEGNGSVSGSVVAGGSGGRGVRVIVGRTYDDGTPLEGITVYLLRASDNSIFKEAVTDAAGQFTITGIPSGSYKFHVDVPGISMGADNPVIELDETKPLELTAVVSDEGIATEVVVIKGLEEEQMAVLIYPNPVSDVLNIRFDGDGKDLVLKVFNLLGQEQLQLQVASGLQSIDFSKQPRGIYILTIQDAKDGRLLQQVKLKKE